MPCVYTIKLFQSVKQSCWVQTCYWEWSGGCARYQLASRNCKYRAQANTTPGIIVKMFISKFQCLAMFPDIVLFASIAVVHLQPHCMKTWVPDTLVADDL